MNNGNSSEWAVCIDGGGDDDDDDNDGGYDMNA